MNPKRNPSKPPPLLPRAFRKRMSPQRLADISLVHHVNLDALLKGDPAVLADFGSSVLTWRNVADRLLLGQEEIKPQVELFDRLVAQFQATGFFTLSEQDRQIAREGVAVMNLLAQEVDIANAAWCAEWSSAEIQRRFAR